MKDLKTRMLVLAGLLTSAGALIAQQASLIDLFIQPDVNSRKIGRVAMENPKLDQPAPVMDEAKAALGWHYADFTDTVEGYVQDAKIGKDLIPVEDAIIYASPSTSSPVLGVYNFGENVEIVDTGKWWTIRVEMNFPVYFVLNSPPPLPPVTGEAPEAVAATPPPLAELPEPDFMATDNSQPARQTAADGGVALTAERKTMRNPPDVLGQRYEGTFRKSKRNLGLFKPKAPFLLEGANGKRIAWVDTDDIVIPGSLNQFLDKVVIVHGERDLLDSKEWIIRARNMRIK